MRNAICKVVPQVCSNCTFMELKSQMQIDADDLPKS